MGMASQEADFLGLHVYAVDQGVKVGWVVEGVGLGLDAALDRLRRSSGRWSRAFPIGRDAARFSFWRLTCEAGDGDGGPGKHARRW